MCTGILDLFNFLLKNPQFRLTILCLTIIHVCVCHCVHKYLAVCKFVQQWLMFIVCVYQVWVNNSQLPGDHVVAGSFETAARVR